MGVWGGMGVWGWVQLPALSWLCHPHREGLAWVLNIFLALSVLLSAAVELQDD